jgi:hypothetical protein
MSPWWVQSDSHIQDSREVPKPLKRNRLQGSVDLTGADGHDISEQLRNVVSNRSERQSPSSPPLDILLHAAARRVRAAEAHFISVVVGRISTAVFSAIAFKHLDDLFATDNYSVTISFMVGTAREISLEDRARFTKFDTCLHLDGL